MVGFRWSLFALLLLFTHCTPFTTGGQNATNDAAAAVPSAGDGGSSSTRSDGGPNDTPCLATPFRTRFPSGTPLNTGFNLEVTYGEDGTILFSNGPGETPPDGTMRIEVVPTATAHGRLYFKEFAGGDLTPSCIKLRTRIRIQKFPQTNYGTAIHAIRFANERLIMIGITSGGRIEFAQQGPEYEVLATRTVAVNQWHDLAVTLTDNLTRIASHLDGTLVQPTDVAFQPLANPERVEIGVIFAAEESDAKFEVDSVDLF
jgi:hypothetical protein